MYTQLTVRGLLTVIAIYPHKQNPSGADVVKTFIVAVIAATLNYIDVITHKQKGP